LSQKEKETNTRERRKIAEKNKKKNCIKVNKSYIEKKKKKITYKIKII
jgi:hypothetical protein